MRVKRSQSDIIRIKAKDNMGHDWYNLPRTSTDPETKKHLQLLHTRHIWDAKKHWRKSTLPLPTFSQIVSRYQPIDAHIKL